MSRDFIQTGRGDFNIINAATVYTSHRLTIEIPPDSSHYVTYVPERTFISDYGLRRSEYLEEIVRCKECIHSIYETEEHDSMICLNGDQWSNEPFVNADGMGYCAWGERSDDA